MTSGLSSGHSECLALPSGSLTAAPASPWGCKPAAELSDSLPTSPSPNLPVPLLPTPGVHSSLLDHRLLDTPYSPLPSKSVLILLPLLPWPSVWSPMCLALPGHLLLTEILHPRVDLADPLFIPGHSWIPPLHAPVLCHLKSCTQ